MDISTGMAAVQTLDPASSGAWRRVIDPKQTASYRERGWWRDRSHLDDFLKCVETNPDKVAVVSCSDGRERRRLTYRELGQFVDRCAAHLLQLGIEKNDVVSLHMPNGWEFPVMVFAAMRVGAIPNPIPIIYREFELSFMLRHAGSKLLLTPVEFRGFAHAALGQKLKQEIPTLQQVVTTDGRVEGLLAFEDFIADTGDLGAADIAKAFASRRPGADDPAVMLFTSGTTGTPKAAIHTHNTIWSAGRGIPDALGMTGDDVCFMASTMGHLTGFYWGMLLPLSLGQKVVYQDAWDPRGMLRLIEKEGITWTLSATPFALDLVEAQKEMQLKVNTLRAFVCGGAAIPPHVAIIVHEHLGVELISLWGCTELGICTIHHQGTPVEILAESDGLRVPHTEVRIVDDDGKPVATGQEGRLQVRGPSTFVGYFLQPELTADMQTPDGWFDSGDLGRTTPHGGIRITGRSKDIIIRGGQNVPVVEIENELCKHPGIKEVVVIGVPDPRLGERGCAVIVPRGTPPSLHDIRQQLQAVGVAKQFWPEYLEVVSEMPRTPAGKIKRYVLRETLAGKSFALE